LGKIIRAERKIGTEGGKRATYKKQMPSTISGEYLASRAQGGKSYEKKETLGEECKRRLNYLSIFIEKE